MSGQQSMAQLALVPQLNPRMLSHSAIQASATPLSFSTLLGTDLPMPPSSLIHILFHLFLFPAAFIIPRVQ